MPGFIVHGASWTCPIVVLRRRHAFVVIGASSARVGKLSSLALAKALGVTDCARGLERASGVGLSEEETQQNSYDEKE